MRKEGIHSKCYLTKISYFMYMTFFISRPVVQVLDVSTEGKEEVFYGPTLPFASNGIATCFLPAPYFTCPNLQTLQVPHHRIV